MHSACVHVHVYMHTYALCGYTRPLRTCRYAAILVNRPSGISQAAAVAVNRTQGVNQNICSRQLHSGSCQLISYCKAKLNQYYL